MDTWTLFSSLIEQLLDAAPSDQLISEFEKRLYKYPYHERMSLGSLIGVKYSEHPGFYRFMERLQKVFENICIPSCVLSLCR